MGADSHRRVVARSQTIRFRLEPHAKCTPYTTELRHCLGAVRQNCLIGIISVRGPTSRPLDRHLSCDDRYHEETQLSNRGEPLSTPTLVAIQHLASTLPTIAERYQNILFPENYFRRFLLFPESEIPVCCTLQDGGSWPLKSLNRRDYSPWTIIECFSTAPVAFRRSKSLVG